MSHDFKQQLAWSEAQGHEPFWNAVYQKAFPDMVSHLLCSGNTKGQRSGVDRIVYLRNDKVLRIDEKKRAKDYPDILLEYMSVDTTLAPGWIEKDLTIDYLAYAFMPSRKCYLFDWLMLKRAWRRYGADWKAKYKPPVVAKNATYNTISVAVPIFILLNAVATASVIDVSNELKGWISK